MPETNYDHETIEKIKNGGSIVDPKERRPGESLKNFFHRMWREAKAPGQKAAFDNLARQNGVAAAEEVFGKRDELPD